MKMTPDPIRERELERVGIDDMGVRSDGWHVIVEMRGEDFDRLMRLARGAGDYWDRRSVDAA